MELAIWSGSWGLPSVDADCLAALAYCKFSKAPVNIQKTNNPWKSPNGKLPYLCQDEKKYCSTTQIFECLRKNNYGADSTLSIRQTSDVYAFTALLEERLRPALLYTLWVDGKTSVDMSRPWMARHLPFWLKFYWPGRVQREASNRVKATVVDNHKNLTDKELENEVYKNAKECLNLLETRLGSNAFFFGDEPSSLDALVFGYLAPILKAPMSSSILQQHLNGCPMLVKFCETILKQHFPLTPEEIEQKKKEENAETKAREEDFEFPHRKRNMILAGLFAVTAMVSYAFMSGLVRIEVHDDIDEDDLNEVELEEED